MKFGDVPVGQAAGAILAHSLRVGEATFKKGRVLSEADAAALAAAGFGTVVAVRMERGDLDENAAAARIARAVAGDNTSLSTASTGRCNIPAAARGVAVVDAVRVDRLNLVHESLTLATVMPYTAIDAGDLVATVKIISFAVAERDVAACEAVAGEGGPLVRVAPFAPRRVGLVQTRLPVVREQVLDKAVEVTRLRLAGLGSTLVEDVRCDHTATSVARAFEQLKISGCDIALALGASAIADRRDVIPAAVGLCGGTVEHLGMPVDPGNLMMLARIGKMHVLGLPGSARSPRLHGFDWVLQRLAAGIAVSGEDLMRMGVGGLLKEIPGRPMPRASVGTKRSEAPARRGVAALVLAAGQSRRMGPINKLLAEVAGRPMVAHAVDAALASGARPVIVVTGHEPDRLRAALAGREVTFVHNPDYAQGLSTSLRAGVNLLDETVDGAVICLGDMPAIRASHIDRLIAAFDPAAGREICVPTFNGKRGNPVLWHQRFFVRMAEVSGDVGARHLIGENEDVLVEVPMDDDAVLADLDTPAALAAHKAARES